MFTKEIFKTHLNNLALAKDVMRTNGMLETGITLISIFWITAVNDILDEEMLAQSAEDAYFIGQVISEINTERASDLRYMFLAVQKRGYRWATYIKTLRGCLKAQSKPEIQVSFLENATQANDVLHELIEHKADGLKYMSSHLAGIQGRLMGMPPRILKGLPEGYDKALVNLIKTMLLYLARNDYFDENFKCISVSLEDLISSGLTEAEAKEFIADFSNVDELMEFEAIKAAYEGGPQAIVKFAREHLEKKHSGH